VGWDLEVREVVTEMSIPQIYDVTEMITPRVKICRDMKGGDTEMGLRKPACMPEADLDLLGVGLGREVVIDGGEARMTMESALDTGAGQGIVLKQILIQS